MGKIFISYRRSDAANVTNHIYRELKKKYRDIFFDIEAIDGGALFSGEIAQAVADSKVFLPIIGETWLDVTENDGTRRIDNPDDFVREEISLALTLPDVKVIPVLLNNTAMPNEDELPKRLRALSRHNAVTIRDGRDFENDLDRLMEEIDKAMPKRRSQLLGIGIIVVLVAIIFFLTLNNSSASNEGVIIDDPDLPPVSAPSIAGTDSIGGDPICETGQVRTSGYSGTLLFSRTTQKYIADDPETEEDEYQRELRDIVSIDLETCKEYWYTNSPLVDDRDPIWYGDEMLFVTNHTGNTRISRWNANDNTVTNLTDFVGYFIDISSDGETLYYQGWSTENEAWNVFAYDLSTQASRNLTNSDKFEGSLSLIDNEIGNYIVLHRHNENDLGNIIRLNLETTTETNLSRIEQENSEETHEVYPSFASNGTVAYVRNDRASEPETREIWLMDFDGSNKRNLTKGQWASEPIWSPDGQYIVYMVWEHTEKTGYSWNPWIMNSDGSNKRPIFRTEPNEGLLYWR